MLILIQILIPPVLHYLSSFFLFVILLCEINFSRVVQVSFDTELHCFLDPFKLRVNLFNPYRDYLSSFNLIHCLTFSNLKHHLTLSSNYHICIGFNGYDAKDSCYLDIALSSIFKNVSFYSHEMKLTNFSQSDGRLSFYDQPNLRSCTVVREKLELMSLLKVQFFL